MKITFHGAARGVTGSKHLIETSFGRVLLDCGLFQGKRKESEFLNKNLPDIGGSLDAVILSHAHLDHCGALPILIKQGFSGNIYMTPATAEVAYYILMDSAHIQEQDVAYLNQKKQEKGEPLEEPLYTEDDVKAVFDHFVSIPYYEPFQPIKGMTATFFDAGHILGSAQIHMTVKENDTHTTIAYTGDLGRWNMPILRDPDPLPDTQILLTESTYGDRLHDSFEETRRKLHDVVIEAVARKAKIIIPAFALGRTQELIFILHDLISKKEIPSFPIYIDSPLSGNISDVFKNHPECFDEETYKKFIDPKNDAFGLNSVMYTSSPEESKAINHVPGPIAIISASGMCEFGRIRHHLANNISDPNNLILVTGFMAENTLGRKLVEGETSVKIWDTMHEVRAELQIFNGFSAHADYQEIIKHVRRLPSLTDVFLVHGEDTQMQRLSDRLRILKPGLNVHIPHREESFSL